MMYHPLLEFAGSGLLARNCDFQVSVAAAQLVNEFLFQFGVPEGELVGQAQQAAHVGSLHLRELAAVGVALEQVVKDTGIVQIFGNGDVQGLVTGRFLAGAEVYQVVEDADTAQHNGDDKAVADVSHAHDQPCSHGQENGANLFGGAGYRAEAHQVEGARHRHSRADVAVNHHDDDAYHGGEQSQGGHEAFGVPGAHHVGQGQQ